MLLRRILRCNQDSLAVFFPSNGLDNKKITFSHFQNTGLATSFHPKRGSISFTQGLAITPMSFSLFRVVRGFRLIFDIGLVFFQVNMWRQQLDYHFLSFRILRQTFAMTHLGVTAYLSIDDLYDLESRISFWNVYFLQDRKNVQFELRT